MAKKRTKINYGERQYLLVEGKGEDTRVAVVYHRVFTSLDLEDALPFAVVDNRTKLAGYGNTVEEAVEQLSSQVPE